MTLRWAVVTVAVLGVIVTDPALARSRHKARPNCAAQPLQFSWTGWLFNPPPQPNGCSPPVYFNGEFVGQDPDANIRTQLKRDPATGNLYDLY